MAKIVEYTIVDNFGLDDTRRAVNANIKTGWQPFGNLIMIEDSDHKWTYAQAMVKYEDE